jgi:hypothetical protein
VSCGANSRRADDVDSHIPLLTELSLTGVDADSDAKWLWRVLDRLGRGEGIRSSCERTEERITLRIDLHAVVVDEGFAHRAPVISDEGRITMAKLSEQTSRALDVGEQEGDGSGWTRGHHAERDRTCLRLLGLAWSMRGGPCAV